MPKFGDLLEQAKKAGAIASLIPDGDFRLECTNSNAKEDERIGLLWKVVGEAETGAELPEDDAARGASGWTNLYFSEKAANISMAQLKSYGMTDEFLAASETAEEVADAMKGVIIDASVGHRNWGKDGENVSNTFKNVEVVVGPVLPQLGVPVNPEEPF